MNELDPIKKIVTLRFETNFFFFRLNNNGKLYYFGKNSDLKTGIKNGGAPSTYTFVRDKVYDISCG